MNATKVTLRVKIFFGKKGQVIALFVWACLADKPWLKVLLADLV